MFVSHGVDQAITLGAELGLKAGTVKSWTAAWSKTTVAGKSDTTPSSKRVWDRTLEQHGVLIVEGPEVSQIRYDDGATRYTINKYWSRASKTKRERR